MVICFRLDIDMIITVEEGYDHLVDENNNLISLSRLTKKQKEEAVANTKAKLELKYFILYLENGKYSTTKDLWERIIEMHEK